MSAATRHEETARLIAQFTEQQTLALTLFGECDDQPTDGKIAVAWVIRNRVARKQGGPTYKAVCLAPAQFTCWHPTCDAELANFGRLLTAARGLVEPNGAQVPPSYFACEHVAEAVMSGKLPDPTHGACHYMTTALLHSTKAPHWAAACDEVAVIGAHTFLVERREVRAC